MPACVRCGEEQREVRRHWRLVANFHLAIDPQARERADRARQQVQAHVAEPEAGRQAHATSGAKPAPISQARSEVSAAPV